MDYDAYEQWERERAEAMDSYFTPAQVAEIREKVTMDSKWEKIRDPILPEPNEFENVSFGRAHSLFDHFKETGLQVIVKMASIELTPEKPDFPAGGWHVSSPSRTRAATAQDNSRANQ